MCNERIENFVLYCKNANVLDEVWVDVYDYFCGNPKKKNTKNKKNNDDDVLKRYELNKTDVDVAFSFFETCDEEWQSIVKKLCDEIKETKLGPPKIETVEKECLLKSWENEFKSNDGKRSLYVGVEDNPNPKKSEQYVVVLSLWFKEVDEAEAFRKRWGEHKNAKNLSWPINEVVLSIVDPSSIKNITSKRLVEKLLHSVAAKKALGPFFKDFKVTKKKAKKKVKK